LPVDVTSFVGRRAELAEAKRLLGGTRLLTLVGPGGVGKTRLALRIAADVRRTFTGGVCFVELPDLHDAKLLPHTVAESLGLRDSATEWTPASLVSYLADLHLLLVLDNCEHLIEPCAALARDIIGATPDIRILATSREALRIAGEQTMAVPPLAVPEEAAAESGDLLSFESVQLFIDRAGARVPGFALTDANRPHVAGICRQLDGIPLAIELAADRVRALSAEQIEQRLRSRLRLLTSGNRVAPSRQQTLRASIQWSYDLASPAEQRLWERLSVFAGGFELDAVEGVCATEDQADPVDLLSALLDKSILIRAERGSRVRYRMLETIREFGADRLADRGETSELRHQHLDWYQRLVQSAYDEWIGANQAELLSRLHAEQANIRAALEFSCAEGPVEAGLHIASALTHYWIARGRLSEGRHWLDEVAACCDSPSVALASAFRLAAHLAVIQGATDAVDPLLDRARAILEECPDATEHAQLSFVAGMASLLSDQHSRATHLLAEALREFQDCADLTGEIYSLVVAGLTELVSDRLAQAEGHLRACLDITRTRGETWFQSHALNYLALVRWRQGDAPAAAGLVADALRLKTPLADELGIALCLEALAWIATATGEHTRAATLLGAADSAWERADTTLDSFPGLDQFHAACVAELRARLNAHDLDELRFRGSQVSTGEVLAFATGGEVPATHARATLGRDTTNVAPLTRREWEIAQEVAGGLSNRDIATKLVISQRTAEGHVEHILVKLGFKTRAQIAAWVSERRRTAE
jgi:predicted ATPase/DNA-binding CsgD family transcriptional regulator